MVQEKTNVRHIIREFVAKLEPDIMVDKVILFGSYARGTAGQWSDIDIAVISDDFRRMRTLDKIRLIARRSAHCDSRLEPFGYSLIEYNHADRLSFLGEIKRMGKVVYTRRKQRIPTRKPRNK
jgi:uncharacterized protein